MTEHRTPEDIIVKSADGTETDIDLNEELS